jgi:hypothetical protein
VGFTFLSWLVAAAGTWQGSGLDVQIAEEVRARMGEADAAEQAAKEWLGGIGRAQGRDFAAAAAGPPGAGQLGQGSGQPEAEILPGCGAEGSDDSLWERMLSQVASAPQVQFLPLSTHLLELLQCLHPLQPLTMQKRCESSSACRASLPCSMLSRRLC